VEALLERRFAVILGLVVLAVAGGVAWWTEPEAEPEPVAEHGFRDTGMTAEAREELMRSIGYVQQ